MTGAPAPCPPWCRAGEAAHRDGGHVAHLGRWRIGPVDVAVRILQSGEHEPLVHVDMVHDSGKRRVLELDASQAITASDVIDMFDPLSAEDVSEAAEMLYRAADTINPGHERVTPW